MNEQLKSELSVAHSQLKRLAEQQDSSTATNDLRIARIMEEANNQTKKAEERVEEREEEVKRLEVQVENMKGQMSRISDGANDYRNQYESLKISFDKVSGDYEMLRMLHKQNESTIADLETENVVAADARMVNQELRAQNEALSGEVERLRVMKESRGREVEELKGRLDAAQLDLKMARSDLEGSEVAMSNMHLAMQNLQGERESEIRMMEQQAEEERAGEREAFEGRLEALAEVHDSNIADIKVAHKKEIRIERDKLETLNVKYEAKLTENVGLRRSLDEAIKRLQASQEDVIDRVLMKNILLDWHGKNGEERRDVMAVMASLLHFTDEEKASANLYFEKQEDKGVVGRVVGGIVAPLPPPVLNVEELEGENVRDKFVQFLLAESGGD